MGDQDLTVEAVHGLLVSDFRDAWNLLAGDDGTHGSGNLMFAREALALLELIARVCREDPSGLALRDVSTELERIEPRYFTRLPAPSPRPAGFDLPASPRAGPPDNQLLHAIFDLIANGHAEQQRHIVLATTDHRTFGVAITGAEPGLRLDDRLASGRPPEHLSLTTDDRGDVFVVVCPEVLFLDLEATIAVTGVFRRNLRLPPTEQPAPSDRRFDYTSLDVELALRRGGHPPYRVGPAPEAAAARHPVWPGLRLVRSSLRRVRGLSRF